MNRFGTLLSKVSGLSVGVSDSAMALDASAPHQFRIRVISRQQEDALGRNRLCLAVALDDHLGRPDLDDARLETRGDRALLDAVIDVGADPILD